MLRTLAVAVLLVPALRAADPPALADLVKQLGDPKFAVREAAQKELVKRGEGIAADLEKLVIGADPETAERVGKIRYALVGYKDDIRRLLAEVDDGQSKAPSPVSDELRGLIAAHQPGAGDLLLTILTDPKHQFHLQTLRTFVATWNVATADQLEAYIRQAVTLTTTHRSKFPAKVGAMISFEAQLRDGWMGWPNQELPTFKFMTRTTRYLDGKPYDKPFDYRYPFATVGWYRLGELSEGKHTIHAVMEYEFTQNGQKRKGELRSKDWKFEIVSADTPDDLIAPTTAELMTRFRTSFFVHEGQRQASELAFDMPVLPERQSDWQPQVSWKSDDNKWHGLSCPAWILKEGMQADLCFDVEIWEVKSGKTFAADPICVRSRQGRLCQGYIAPKRPDLFAADKEGFVSVKIRMKPSRALALTDASITRYYPGSFESGEIRMRLSTAVAQEHLYKTDGK